MATNLQDLLPGDKAGFGRLQAKQVVGESGHQPGGVRAAAGALITTDMGIGYTRG